MVIADFDKEAGFENEKFIKEKNGSAMFIETNVGDEGSVKYAQMIHCSNTIRNLVQKTVEKFGTIDVLVNNAGLSKFINIFDENSTQRFDEVRLSANISFNSRSSTSIFAELFSVPNT